TQSYGDAVALGADTTLQGSTVTNAAAIAGNAHALTVTGNAVVGGAISGVTHFDVSGSTSLGANVSTAGTQSYGGAVNLAQDASLTSTGAGAAGNIDISGAIDGGQALTITTPGSITLAGNAGAVTALASLTLNGGDLSLHDVTTSGAQSYTGPATTHSAYRSAGGAIAFANDLTIASPLVVDTTLGGAAGGAVSFGGSVSSAPPQTHGMSITAGTGTLTASGAVALPSVEILSAGTASLDNAANTIGSLAGHVGAGGLSARNAAGLTIAAAGLNSSGGNVNLVTSAGNLVLDGTISAAGSGNIVLSTAANFVNNAGASALATTSGRWLVYSTSPLLDTRAGLAPQFKLYNASLGSSLPAGTAGQDGYVYSIAPVVTPQLVGTVQRVYDATRNAALTAANYDTATGSIDGDIVVLNNPSAGLYDTKVAATGKTVSVSGLSIAGASEGSATVYGYTLDRTATSAAIGVVTQAPLTVVGLVGLDKVYDGTSNATLSTAAASANGVLQGDSISLVRATGSFADKNVGSGKAVTADAIQLAGTDQANYALVPVSGLSAAITPRSLNVTASGQNKVYDGLTTATVALADNRIAGDQLGVDYSANFLDKNAGINKFVSVTGITLTGTDAGNYSANATAAAFADISKATLVVSATGVNRAYDGSTQATVSLSDNRVGGDQLTLAYGSAAFDTRNAGLGKTVNVAGIAVSGSDVGNYSFNTTAQTTADILGKLLTVTGVQALDKVYDGGTGATLGLGAAQLVGVVGNDAVQLGTGAGVFGDKNVGSGKTVTASSLLLTGADADGYLLQLPSGLTASITPATLTAIGGITASNKVYDGAVSAALQTGAATFSGRIGSDDLSVTQAVGSFADKHVGSAKTVTIGQFVLGGADAGNYVFSGTSTAQADITPKALTVSGITASNKVYDGGTVATVSTAAASFGGLVQGDSLSVSTTGSFADKNVGAGKNVSLSSSYGGADVGNYAITDQAATSADITPKALTVSGITASNKVYDGGTGATVSTAAASLGGLVTGDAVSVSASGSFGDKNVGSAKTVTLVSSYTGADLGNYSVTDQASASADITPKALTVSGITATGKVYDGGTAATVSTAAASFGGLVQGDSLSVSTTGAFADKNVGASKTVALSSSYSGADAGNYAIADQASTSADITPKALTVSGITASNKVYDGGTVATVSTAAASFGGLVQGDSLSVSTTGSFADKNVGAGKNVSLSSSYGGADVGNYAITDQAATSADITPKALTVSGITASNKVYDGGTGATVSTAAASLGGLVTGDAVSVSASGSFGDKNVGSAKTVTLVSSYTGADLGNYSVTDQASASADITP
ncbi:beta strand repeat-containing protein, partial [Rubrivivax sp. A210]|uniref:beta strand repeat-containing protein n=1 Tax=Rubrivivax sp. A210 TaxID=2772301 RepID=UPI001F433D91